MVGGKRGDRNSHTRRAIKAQSKNQVNDANPFSLIRMCVCFCYSYPIFLNRRNSSIHSPLIQLWNSCFRSPETTEVMIPVFPHPILHLACISTAACTAVFGRFVHMQSCPVPKQRQSREQREHASYRLPQNLTPVNGSSSSHLPPASPPVLVPRILTPPLQQHSPSSLSLSLLFPAELFDGRYLSLALLPHTLRY